MSEDNQRRRDLWRLGVAQGLGYGGLGLAVLAIFVLPFAPGFILLGIALIAVALVIGVLAKQRVKRLPQREEASASSAEPAVGGCALGCAVVLVAPFLLLWLLPPSSHGWFGVGSRESPRKAVCLSNVKNLALALRMYLADNNDAFPRVDAWCDSLEDYMKNRQVLQCPSVRDRDRGCDYAYNDALGGASMSDLADPATTVAIFESDVGWNAAGDANILPAAPRHLEGDNYALADGTARWVKREDLALGRAEIGWSVKGAE